MFSILTNDLLRNPVPVQLTLNYCSHGCSYCFANLNNPKRKADLKKCLSQLKNYKNRNDLVFQYLKLKYPVLISNNVDPFSKNNYQLTQQIVNVLQDEGIPVQLNTRGGFGWQEVADNISPSLFIVSHAYADDEVRKKYEGNAPSLDERFEMVKHLNERHNVIIGINPFDRALHQGRYREIIDRYIEIGVNKFWVNKLHLSYKQQANMISSDKEIYTDECLKDAANRNKFSEEWLEDFVDIREYAAETGAVICGTPSGHYESYIDESWGVYEKLMPTLNDFYRWCQQNKSDGDLVEFSEFYDFFAPLLPDIEANISSYIENKANIADKTFYQKTRLSNILHVYWDSKAGLKIPEYSPCFSWVKKQFPNKLDWVKDANGDRVMEYHPNNYNVKDFKILKELETA